MLLSGEQLVPATPGLKYRLEDNLMYEFILYRARTLIHSENSWTCLGIDVLGGSCSNKRTDKRKILVCVRWWALYRTQTIITGSSQSRHCCRCHCCWCCFLLWMYFMFTAILFSSVLLYTICMPCMSVDLLTYIHLVNVYTWSVFHADMEEFCLPSLCSDLK
jgi:hypothetical protein